MDFLVNELSLAGQFPDFATFHHAVDRLMKIRQEILRVGSSIYCHRRFADAKVTATTVMQQAIQVLPMEQRRAWMQWLTKQGPYWEDAQLHDENEWLEVNGEIVTDTAIGEAAICCSRGLSRELVSLVPSDWLFTPIVVTWMLSETLMEDISVANSHPEIPGETLFAPWHGKVKTPQIRIHFSWPVRFDTPLYVLYVGPKITKR